MTGINKSLVIPWFVQSKTQGEDKHNTVLHYVWDLTGKANNLLIDLFHTYFPTTTCDSETSRH